MLVMIGHASTYTVTACIVTTHPLVVHLANTLHVLELVSIVHQTLVCIHPRTNSIFKFEF